LLVLTTFLKERHGTIGDRINGMRPFASVILIKRLYRTP
jgi:hypothetical protein